MTARVVSFVLVALLSIPFTSSAEMYQYVDDQGTLHFVDGLSEVPKKHRRKARMAGEDGTVSYSDHVAARSGVETSTGYVRKKVEKKVEVYVTSWCRYCKMAVNYLNDHGIPFTSYDIEKDGAANKRYESFSGRGVPLIVVGGNTMRGFDASRLEALLNN